MTEAKSNELVQSAQGLLIASAAIVLAALIRGTAGTIIGIAGIVAFLFFGLTALWALSGKLRRR